MEKTKANNVHKQSLANFLPIKNHMNQFLDSLNFHLDVTFRTLLKNIRDVIKNSFFKSTQSHLSPGSLSIEFLSVVPSLAACG